MSATPYGSRFDPSFGVTALFIAVLGLAGCGGFTEPLYHAPLDGAWAGATAAPSVRLTLRLHEVEWETTATRIEGSGEISGAGPTTPVKVRGKRTGPEVRLLIEPDGYMAIEFTATLEHSARLDGKLLGSGIVDLPFELTRAGEAATDEDEGKRLK